MAGKPQFSADQNTRLRVILRRELDRHGTQDKLAKLLGIPRGSLAQLAIGRSGFGFPVAEKLCEIAEIPLQDVLNPRPPTSSSTARPAAHVEYERPDRPRFGSLPGWPDAEREARRMARGSIPEQAWKDAADAAGMKMPREVTPMFVLDLARAFAHQVDDDSD